VTQPGAPEFEDHPESLLLAYLEDELRPEERAEVEHHLEECPKCAEELRTVKLMHALLREHAEEVTCPEASQLYEFARIGLDPTGKLRRHMDTCPACREEITAYRNACADTPTPELMPQVVRDAFKEQTLGPQDPTPPRLNWLLSSLLDGVNVVVRRPISALGTAAAVVLLLVLLYPRGAIEPILVLSSISWGEGEAKWSTMNIAPEEPMPPVRRAPATRSGTVRSAPHEERVKVEKRAAKMRDGTRTTLEEQRPKVSMVILLKGFSESLPQDRVDELYNALDPSLEMRRRFEFIPPGQVKKSIGVAEFEPVNLSELGGKLQKELGVSKLVAITLTPERHGVGIETQILDTETRTILAQTRDREISSDDIVSRLSQSARTLLENTTGQ